jgi:hypothetical protein
MYSFAGDIVRHWATASTEQSFSSMRSFTFWSVDPHLDEDDRPLALFAISAGDAVREADRLWTNCAWTPGPARFRVYDDTTGRLIYERAPGPSC